MPQPSVITLHSPLPLAWLGWIVAGAAVVFLWHTLRQWSAAKRAWLLPVLWLLRVAAVAALAAMVAGPSLTQTSRQTTRQSIAVLVDSSGSMSLNEAEAHTAEWSKPRAEDPALGCLSAALFQLLALEKLSAGQLIERPGLERTQDTAAALAEALPLLSPEQASSLRSGVAALEVLAKDLGQGRAIVQADARRLFAEVVATLRQLLPTLQPQPAPPQPENDAGPKARRLARVATWLDEAQSKSGWLTRSRESFDVELLDVADGVAKPITADTLAGWMKREPQRGSPRTDLATMMEAAGRTAALNRSRALIFVTDGAHNAERAAEEAAARLRGLPVMLVPIGAALAKEQQDLALSQVAAPRSVFLHDTIQIEPLVSAAGFEGRSIDIVLRSGTNELDRQQARVQSGSTDRPITFQWKPQALGPHTLTVEVLPLPGDAFTDNNKRSLPIEVLDDSVRLLLADSQPRWETRYLLNLLKRDERMSFATVLAAPMFKADGKSLLHTRTLPVSVAEWAQYRVVILGDVGPEMMPAESQQGLLQFISERGGTAILIAGSDAMPSAFVGQPLEAMLPVTLGQAPSIEGYTASVSASGRRFPLTQLADTPEETEAIWQRQTTRLPLFNLSPWSVAKPQATVLLRAQPLALESEFPRALLSFQDVGKGRVIFLAAPSSWHLRYTEGDTFHYRFWGQLLHWAVARDMETGSRCVHLSASRPSLKQGELVKLTLVLNDLLGQARTGAKCEIEMKQRERSVGTLPFAEEASTPGTYSVTVTELPLGPVNFIARGEAITQLFKLENREATAELTLSVAPPDNRELRDLLRDQAMLARLAQASEGTQLPPHAVPFALKHLGLRPSTSETSQHQPLWNEWPLLIGLLGLLAIEWSLRRVAGVL